MDALAFVKEWGWLALSVASGGLSVAAPFILSFFGKAPPSNFQTTFLWISSVVAALMMAFRERKKRREYEGVNVEQPQITPFSATVALCKFENNGYFPRGSLTTALCTFANGNDGIAAKDVQVQITVATGEVFKSDRCCWLSTNSSSISFEKNTQRIVVLAEWSFRVPFKVPKFIGDEIHPQVVAADSTMTFTIVLYTGDKVLCTAYCEMTPGTKGNSLDYFSCVLKQ